MHIWYICNGLLNRFVRWYQHLLIFYIIHLWCGTSVFFPKLAIYFTRIDLVYCHKIYACVLFIVDIYMLSQHKHQLCERYIPYGVISRQTQFFSSEIQNRRQPSIRRSSAYAFFDGSSPFCGVSLLIKPSDSIIAGISLSIAV